LPQALSVSYPRAAARNPGPYDTRPAVREHRNQDPTVPVDVFEADLPIFDAAAGLGVPIYIHRAKATAAARHRRQRVRPVDVDDPGHRRLEMARRGRSRHPHTVRPCSRAVREGSISPPSALSGTSASRTSV
jgi:hypothetical protein